MKWSVAFLELCVVLLRVNLRCGRRIFVGCMADSRMNWDLLLRSGPIRATGDIEALDNICVGQYFLLWPACGSASQCISWQFGLLVGWTFFR